MTFIVATNVIASRPPERPPTGMPPARANLQSKYWYLNRDLQWPILQLTILASFPRHQEPPQSPRSLFSPPVVAQSPLHNILSTQLLHSRSLCPRQGIPRYWVLFFNGAALHCSRVAWLEVDPNLPLVLPVLPAITESQFRNTLETY